MLKIEEEKYYVMMHYYEFDDPGRTSYGRYEGNQRSEQMYTEIPSQQPLTGMSGEKISSESHNRQNPSRLAIAAMSLLTLIALVVICLLFIGGVSGWVSFLVGCCVILGVAITTTNGSK